MNATDSITVLVIDDDAALTQTMTDFMALAGVRAVATGDIDNYVTLALEVSPDVVVVDLMLAASSGFEVAAALREGPLPDTPRIAVSSSPFMIEIAEESSLFAHVLPKPFDLEQLLVLILECAGAKAGVSPP